LLCYVGSHVVHVFDVLNCTGHEKVHDGPRKRGRKPLDKPYVVTWTPRAVRRRRRQGHGILHVLWPSNILLLPTPVSGRATTQCGGIDVRPRVMQLCPWGNQVAQFDTVDVALLKALANTHGVPVGGVDVPGFGKLGPFMIAAGWQHV
jgi:hypothetical protein